MNIRISSTLAAGLEQIYRPSRIPMEPSNWDKPEMESKKKQPANIQAGEDDQPTQQPGIARDLSVKAGPL